MFEMEIIKAWNKAIALEENWKPTGPRWTFVDADMYMMCEPKTQQETEQYCRLFNDLADNFTQHNKGLTFAEYCVKTDQIENEYNELFGVTR